MKSSPPDDQLVAAYAERDDQQAFALLHARHKASVYSFILGMVHDVELANDLYQDTFAKVVEVLQGRRGSYNPQGRFKGWLLQVARNVVLDHARSRKKWRDAAGDDATYWDQLPDDAPPADQSLQAGQMRSWLDAMIARLPANQREVLLLRQDAELTFKEIAELTEVSINTALGRNRYALKNLRKMMEERSMEYAPGGTVASRTLLAKAIAA